MSGDVIAAGGKCEKIDIPLWSETALDFAAFLLQTDKAAVFLPVCYICVVQIGLPVVFCGFIARKHSVLPLFRLSVLIYPNEVNASVLSEKRRITVIHQASEHGSVLHVMSVDQIVL